MATRRVNGPAPVGEGMAAEFARLELEKAATFVARVTGKNTSVSLVAGGGRFELRGMHMTSKVRATVGVTAETERGGAASVDAAELASIVSQMRGNTVRIDFEGGSAQLTCGSSRINLRATNTVVPAWSRPAKTTDVTIPYELLAWLAVRVRHCISDDETRMQFTGAHLTLAGELVSMTATDGHRLAHATAAMSHGIGAFSPIVPSDALRALLTLPDGEADLSFTATHGRAVCGLYALGWQAVDGAFPDVSKLLNASKRDSTVVTCAELRHLLTLADICDDPKTRFVRVKLADGAVEVSSHSLESGEMNASCDATSAESKGLVRFASNLRYLQDATAHTHSVTIRTEPPYPTMASVLVDEEAPEGRNCRHVLMPMRDD
jgi:DNA polymerase-3 subunit beta